MKLYRLLTGPDDDAFCLRISECLNQGWELYGSPSLTYNGEGVIACQAIIKEVPGQAFHESLDLRNA